MNVEHIVDRALTLLGNKIREQGFTQLRVQECLGWGRSYISQLLTKQKALRFDQVLLILHVVGADPAEFFAELYRLPPAADADDQALSDTAESIAEQRRLLVGMVNLLLEKKIITPEDLPAALKAVRTKG